MEPKNILTLIPHYLPGYKSGGPLKTLNSMVTQLGDELTFWIVTKDRDLDEPAPYAGIRIDSWQPIGKAGVYYASAKSLSFYRLGQLIQGTTHELLYLNSLFSFDFTIKPLLLRRFHIIPNVPVILAPRGMLSPSALKLKSLKKLIAMTITKILGLYHGVVWQASSQHEARDIQRMFGEHVPIVIAPDLSSMEAVEPAESSKAPGALKVIFLSRISREKNLNEALQLLSKVQGDISFDIYGPIGDNAYWLECKKTMSALPDNVGAEYHGAIAHEQVPSIMKGYELFFLPTRGENFGHVILEAMLAGCPVLISDQTPWRNLEEKGVGWDMSLHQPQRFYKALQLCINMNQNEHQQWRERARKHALQFIHDKTALEQNRKLFSQALSKSV